MIINRLWWCGLMGAGVGMGRACRMAMGGQERKVTSFNFSQDGKVIVTPEYNYCCLSHLVPWVTSFFRSILWKHASKVFWRSRKGPLHIFIVVKGSEDVSGKMGNVVRSVVGQLGGMWIFRIFCAVLLTARWISVVAAWFRITRYKNVNSTTYFKLAREYSGGNT